MIVEYKVGDRFTLRSTRENGDAVELDCGVYASRIVESLKHWAFPVGSKEYPPEMWYVATQHSLDGSKNGGYKHSGIDINLYFEEKGDVERRLGLMVYSLGDGDITFMSTNWYGNPMIVIKYQWRGEPLWVRYGHIIPFKSSGRVRAGDPLGAFANWKTGDHLHFDMARNELKADWLAPGQKWVDPKDVLMDVLDPETVQAMYDR